MSAFKKPDVVKKRLKMFVYGAAGVGKTIAALKFPHSAIIDTEKGADFYSNMICERDSVLLQTTDCDEIKKEIKELLIVKHDYKTLIIDPITQVYNSIQHKWDKIFEKYAKTEKAKEVQDFGIRFWGKVKKDYKTLQRLLLQLDMNVIITAHQKDVYGNNSNKIGVTFDSMRGDDYFFDLVFRIEKRGKDRICIVDKERAEPGKEKFPPEFKWSYENFLKYYGEEMIEKESVPVVMASEKQIQEIQQLTEIVKIPDDQITKWFTKAYVDSWEEMTSDQITKCIEFVSKKLDGIKNGGVKK